jgi:hypothetical protein
VPTEEIERFERDFASLFPLVRRQGRQFRAVKKELEAADGKPAYVTDEMKAAIYLRSEVANRNI